MPTYYATSPVARIDPWTFFRDSDALAIDACAKTSGGCATLQNTASGRIILGPGAATAQKGTGAVMVGSGPQAFGLGDLVRGGLSVLKTAIPGPIDDLAIDAINRRLSRPSSPQIAPAMPFAPTGAGPCRLPAVRVGNTCVDPTAALPGGRPLTRPTGTDVGFPAQESVFGLYVEPVEELVQVSRCPPGTVLGKDDRCYDKCALPNNLRKYPKPARLPVTRSDMNAIRKAKSAEKRVAALAKTAGLKLKR